VGWSGRRRKRRKERIADSSGWKRDHNVRPFLYVSPFVLCFPSYLPRLVWDVLVHVFTHILTHVITCTEGQKDAFNRIIDSDEWNRINLQTFKIFPEFFAADVR
jgi:hypothetical protein